MANDEGSEEGAAPVAPAPVKRDSARLRQEFSEDLAKIEVYQKSPKATGDEPTAKPAAT